MENLVVKNLKIQTTINKSTFLSVNDVSFKVEQGETYGIVGNTGAGKSILVRHITSELEKNSIVLGGQSFINGNEVKDPYARHRSKNDKIFLINSRSIDRYNDVLLLKSHFAFQKYTLEDIDLPESVWKLKSKKAYPITKYKMHVLNIMEQKPILIVLDLPKQLDDTENEEILAILKKFQQKLKFTLLVSTSNIELAKKYCDRIAIFYDGRIVEEGKPNELRKELPILEVKDLVVKFKVRGDDLTALRKVSLSLYKDECLAIVGESGSGKSVLTKTFTGMLDANGWIDSGSVIFLGQNISKFKTNKEWSKIRGKMIATVFQDPMTSLNPLLSIGYQISEVLRIHSKMSKRQAKKEAINLLTRVGIPDAASRYNDLPYQYSGGMRQRVVIAIALACRPKILICDEPTTALDVTIQAQILDLIKDLQKEYGFTTVYITHDLGVVANVADKVAVMYSGQIIEYGSVEEIFYEPAHPYTWALLSSLPQLGIKGQDLFAIKGTPPSLKQKIVGDAFAPRNPYALAIDFKEEPPVFVISPTHWAKTWLLDERAPMVEKPAQVANLKMTLEKQIKPVVSKTTKKTTTKKTAEKKTVAKKGVKKNEKE